MRDEMAKHVPFHEFFFFASPEEVIQELLDAIQAPIQPTLAALRRAQGIEEKGKVEIALSRTNFEFLEELKYFWESSQKDWREFVSIIGTIGHWKEFIKPFALGHADLNNSEVRSCLSGLNLIGEKT
jgi:hypothetical protein